jgi:serine/threonine-protein kinase
MAISLPSAGLQVLVVDDPRCFDQESPVMLRTTDPARDLLFGLLALQNGLIDQGQLVAAFHAWTRDKSRPLADHLVGRGDLDVEQRGLLEGLVAQHLKKHGGDAERSLAALPAGRSTREGLARLGDADIDGTMARVVPGSTEREGEAESDRTATYSVGTATGDGQRFRVLRPHAHGGLGAVFVALDQELHREVALKQILDRHADDPASRHRFLLEAEITGGLEHPGIVPVYGLGTHGDGRPYYAMRFIRGDSLKGAIEHFHGDASLRADPGRRSLELRKLLRRFLDVCNAIDYAHSRGVLHRDVKPGNIIVGRHGETLVVDWGLAKATGKSDPSAGERTLLPGSAGGSSETLPGSALGTPAYMSPEQARGDLEHLGPASDVYSLGATLYCLLTGKPPLEGDVADVLRAVQRGDVRSPRQVDPSLDRALEAVCLKAMAFRQEDRYATPKALAEDVERWMADAPVSAWREPWGRRLTRWQARHRAGVMAAAAAVLVALAGLGVVLTVQARANDRLQTANSDLAIANGKVTRANADLQAANAQVQARYELAMDAIRTFHTGVGEDFLLKEPKFQGLRDRLLQAASGFYGKLGAMLGRQTDLGSRRAVAQANFDVAGLTAKVGRKEAALAAHRRVLAERESLARERSSDEELQSDVGLSLLEVGRLLAETGRADDGLAALDRARAVLQELADDHPEVIRHRDALARAYQYTGDVHWGSGRHAEAAASHGQAHVIWEALAKANPTVVRFQNDRARSDVYRGTNLAMLGRMAEAMAAFERARAILQELVESEPAVIQFQIVLAQSESNIGALLSHAGQPAQAMAACERARAIRQRLVDANPGVSEFQSELGQIYTNIGILLSEVGRTAEAATAHSRSVAIFQELVDSNPAVLNFQRDLSNSLNETGDVLRLVGRTAEARASYERAVTILERLVKLNPSIAPEQGHLVQGLKGLGATRLAEGRTADAVATWRRAVEIGERLQSDYGETLYFLACCHALLGGVAGAPGSGLSAEEGPPELGRAMDVLRRAVAAGYRSFDWMRRDPDLVPLRSRPDFQLLMMDLAFPDDPFAH